MLSDLLAHPDVTEDSTLAGAVGVMALHAGLEAGTGILAQRIASRTDSSMYVLTQGPSLRWHVPSTSYDLNASPTLSAFFEHVEVVVSLHGFGRKHLPRTVLVGGAAHELSSRMAGHLSRTTSMNVVGGDDVPLGLRGTHPKNPVNLAVGGGVQLELSMACREGTLAGELVDSVAQFISGEL